MKNICNKPKVMLLCGMTGSGKTTLAANLERDYAAVRFSIDEWMIKLYGHQPIQADFDRLMNDIKELISLVVERLMAIGINVILDYGFWQASERDRVARWIEARGGIPIIYFLNVSLPKLKERLAKRNKNINECTFEITPEMFDEVKAKFEPPILTEGIQIIELKDEL